MLLLGYFRDAARCKWGKVMVMLWARDGGNLGGWGRLMVSMVIPALEY